MSDIAKMIAIAKRFGGGGSGPSEVVILPETEFTVNEEGTVLITEPLQKTVEAGDTLSIVYNGTAYECTGVSAEDSIVFGNIEASGLEGGNPNAPFAVGILKNGEDLDGDGAIDLYGMVMPLDGSTTITLSIVQTEGETSGGGGGASAMIVNIDPSTMTIDKPFSDVHAAVSTGEIVHFLLKDSSKTSWFYPSECTENEIVAFYIYLSGGILQAGGLKISSDGKVAQIGS